MAAYRRLARKYHPDVAPGDEAPTRMTAINAAWELIGDPAKRASFDRERAVRAAMDRSTRPATPTSPAAPAAPRPASQPDRLDSPAASRGPGVAAADAARPRRCHATGRAAARRSAAGTTPRCGRADGSVLPGRHPGVRREPPDIRPVPRLVARRDRAGRPRVPRVARPDADRAAVSRRDRRHPAADRPPARRGRRGDRATRPLPPPLTRIDVRRRPGVSPRPSRR